VKHKVLIIVENAPVPFDTRVWKEALSLRENGYEVTVLSPRDDRCRRGFEILKGVRIYRHPMPREGNGLVAYLAEYFSALFWQFWYAWWIYFRHGFHVIQGCNPPDTIFMIALPFKLLGVKYIFDQHDANPELYLSKYEKADILYKVQMWLEKQTFRFSDVVMTTNRSYRELALTRGGIASENVFIVRNGPDLRTFRAVQPISDLKRGKRYLVGYVGNMSIQEGLNILLDVALHIKTLGRTDIHFTCVGGGPGLAGLRQMTRDKDLDDMVEFTGRVPDKQLLDILSTADVCVNPDKPCEMNNISTMIKIMEYMALGKPIVQFDLKEGRFSAQDASLYASNEDQVADFAAKLLWLLETPGERKRMGAFGHKRVEEQLAWDYSVEHLLAAYSRALPQAAAIKAVPAPSVSKGEGPSYSRQNAVTVTTSRNAVQLLAEHFRCTDDIGPFELKGELSQSNGFFRLGAEICFGQCSSGSPRKSPAESLHDASEHVVVNDSLVQVPFDPVQLVDNLRHERYVGTLYNDDRALPTNRLIRNVYYALRPLLGVSVRRHVQQLYFRGREKSVFPQWPVDTSVEGIVEELLVLAMKTRGIRRLPFIWFWPDGVQSCTTVSHDVETERGLGFCPQLMDLNDRFGIKTSFQIVPEKRYPVSDSMLQLIRRRGFEINVHDLNHDGRLFADREQFLLRARRINQYAKTFGATGFRSAVMYRNVDWFEALDFSYDMSIPNVAHLDPQKGGCCTVFPFAVGEMIELPLTTIQDYSLFHILNDYSTRLWKEQISRIRGKHGLISVIVHPDYIIEKPARRVYVELLEYLCELRSRGETWIALPGEVAHWWRLRGELKLVQKGDEWLIEGKGSERARMAYAVLDNDQLTYEIPSSIGAVSSCEAAPFD
jgi:glycosyltransferase involved in cell wall biosynthesis